MAHNESLHAAQVKVSCRDRECALEIAQWKLLSSRIQEPTRQKLVAEYLKVYVHGFPVLVSRAPICVWQSLEQLSSHIGYFLARIGAHVLRERFESFKLWPTTASEIEAPIIKPSKLNWAHT
jgi:hypothetical protein